MPVDVVMPKLGLTMASGTIARWIKQPGEAVREGEPLVEVSTDKINYEVESPASGTVGRALGNDGDEFACGDVIGTIALAGETDTPVRRALRRPRPSATSTAPDGSAAAHRRSAAHLRCGERRDADAAVGREPATRRRKRRARDRVARGAPARARARHHARRRARHRPARPHHDVGRRTVLRDTRAAVTAEPVEGRAAIVPAAAAGSAARDLPQDDRGRAAAARAGRDRRARRRGQGADRPPRGLRLDRVRGVRRRAAAARARRVAHRRDDRRAVRAHRRGRRRRYAARSRSCPSCATRMRARSRRSSARSCGSPRSRATARSARPTSAARASRSPTSDRSASNASRRSRTRRRRRSWASARRRSARPSSTVR